MIPPSNHRAQYRPFWFCGVAMALVVSWIAAPANLAAARDRSTPKPATSSKAIVPPIAAAKRTQPLPGDEELSLLLGNQVRKLLQERQTAYQELESTKTASARRIADEIKRLEERLEKGPNLKFLVDGITAQVEKLRDLKAKHPVSFEILNRAEMQAFVEEKLEEDMPPQGLRRSEILIKAVGAMSPQTNLRRVLVRMISEQAAGLYDPATKKLYVASSFSLDRPISRIILAHEICHALQDQHFDLKSMISNASHDDDRAMATMSVVEGDATNLMAQYAIEHLRESSPLDFAELLTQDQRAYRAAPFFLRQSLVFPYIAGQQFLISATFGSNEHTDDLFRNPPVSTEQILRPSKYTFDSYRDEPTTVTGLTFHDSGLTTVAQNTMGQFGIKTLFELWKVGTASDIATGWDGDVVQVWAEKTTTPLDLEKRELLEGAGLSFTWISGWDSEEAARKFGQEIGRLYGRGPFAKELAAAKSSGTAVPETSGTLVRLNGTSASLRVLQEGQKIAVIFGHGPAKKLVDQLGDAEVLSHLRAIAIRE